MQTSVFAPLFLDVLLPASSNQFLTKVIILTIAVYVSAYFLRDVVVKDFIHTLLAAVLIAFLDSTVGSFLKIFTLGIWLVKLVVDAIIIMLADYFLKGFQVKNFWVALLMALIISVISSLLDGVL